MIERTANTESVTIDSTASTAMISPPLLNQNTEDHIGIRRRQIHQPAFTRADTVFRSRRLERAGLLITGGIRHAASQICPQVAKRFGDIRLKAQNRRQRPPSKAASRILRCAGTRSPKCHEKIAAVPKSPISPRQPKQKAAKPIKIQRFFFFK